MKKLLLSLLPVLYYLVAAAQTDINNESFKYYFKPTQTGATVIYKGNTHSFTFDLKGKKLKETKAAESAENNNFIGSDKSFIQTSLVPLPQPIPQSFHLSNLTVDQQKEALDGYVDYELDYFANELHVKVTNLKRKWETINGKLFILWYFDSAMKIPGNRIASNLPSQIYVSTVCFNQVWVLNTAFGKSEFEKPKAWLTLVAGTLKLYNRRL